MVFFTYKYLNMEINQLNEQIHKHFIVFSGAENTFKLELFVTEYGVLLVFL